MVFNNKLIGSILENHLSNDEIYQNGEFQCEFIALVEGITIELNVVADTERRLRRIKDEEQMLLEEHTKAFDELREEREEVIEQCRHHSTTYQTGIYNTCDTCGAEVGHGG